MRKNLTIKHDFIVGPTDTDSISFCKKDGSPFSKEELKILLKEINDISPDFIEWEDDGYYQSCLALKAKNYVLYDGKKKSVKGSAFKTSSKEPILKNFMEEIVDSLLEINNTNIKDIYHKYIAEALNVTDINMWSTKKTITESIIKCKNWSQEDIDNKTLRKNEIDVWEAIKNDSFFEGDKIYLYPCKFGTKTIPGGFSEKTGKPLKDKVIEITGLKQSKDWKNDHDSDKLVKRVYDTLKIFKNVINIDEYIDYSKKSNRHLLVNFYA